MLLFRKVERCRIGIRWSCFWWISLCGAGGILEKVLFYGKGLNLGKVLLSGKVLLEGKVVEYIGGRVIRKGAAF